jgi:hypothetical protein
VVEDLDALEVCCETVVACVEPEVCDCVVSGFIFVVFRCGFDVLPLCVVGWGDGFLGEFLLCFLLLIHNKLNTENASCWSYFSLKLLVHSV